MAKRKDLVSMPMPGATAEIIDEILKPMVTEEAGRVNAHTPIRLVLERVARNAYLQGGVHAYGIFVKGEPK